MMSCDADAGRSGDQLLRPVPVAAFTLAEFG
jgi:hypothetical protein